MSLSSKQYKRPFTFVGIVLGIILVYLGISGLNAFHVNTPINPSSNFQLDDPDAGKAQSEVSSQASNAPVIHIMNSPWPLTLSPHESLTPVADARKNYIFSLVGPTYHDNWRIQFISQNRNINGMIVELEFANSGNANFVLTGDNFQLFIPNNTKDKSNSYLENSPVTVKPGEIKKLRIISLNPYATGLQLKLADYYRSIRFEKFEDPILNTRGFTAPKELLGQNGQPITRKTMEVTGAGKFKYQPEGIYYTSNTKIGKLIKPEGGMLLILKVRLANTSQEPMVIKNFTVGSWDSKSNQPALEYTLNSQEMEEALQEWSLPLTIPAQTIVEGFIPFIFKDSNEYIYILGDSNLGKFEFRNMDSFLSLE